MKDDREILTMQAIQKKLIYEAKRSIFGSLFMCILGVMSFGIISLIILAQPDVMFATKLLIIIIESPYFIVSAFFFVRALLRMNKAKRGDFTVVEDVLTEINDNQLSIIQLIMFGGWHSVWWNKAHFYHIFKFQSGKTFIANVEGYKKTKVNEAAKFSFPGDKFYLVFYNASPNKIILLFAAKTHVLKEG